MSTQDLIARIRVILDINYAERLGLAYSANLTDDEFLAFISGNKDLTTEQLINLEAWLVDVEKNIVRPCGHGVPRSDESMIETLIYNARREGGSLSFQSAVNLFGGDSEKAARLLKKACEYGYMIEPPGGIFITGPFSSLIYVLTEEGAERARHLV